MKRRYSESPEKLTSGGKFHARLICDTLELYLMYLINEIMFSLCLMFIATLAFVLILNSYLLPLLQTMHIRDF